MKNGWSDWVDEFPIENEGYSINAMLGNPEGIPHLTFPKSWWLTLYKVNNHYPKMCSQSIFGQVHVSSCRGLDFYQKNFNALHILNSFELQEACQEVKVFQSWLFNRDFLLMAIL